MMMKESLFLLISNVLGRECGAGEGSTNDGEGFFVSGHLNSYQGAPQTTSLQSFFCYLMTVEPFLLQTCVD